jgi:uncharacterized protein YbjT (DUF2867 family)
MILVSGATGNAGGAVARALAAGGEDVRGLIHDDARRADLPDGVDAAVADLNEPETLNDTLAGVSAAFMLSGYDQMPETLALMREAGVERVVLLSSSSAPSGDMTNAVAKYHIVSEQAVRESGLAWTMLQPNTFMSNTLRWLPQLEAGDTIRLPFADVRVATIDPDDLGAVAAAALTSAEHEGKTYRLSGPESVLPAEQVAVLAEALGRNLTFEAQPDDEARAEMLKTTPPEYVDAFFNFFAEGALDESEVLPTVKEITRRKPGTFERWAKAHAAAFGG